MSQMIMTPTICPICYTKTGINLRDAEWYCMVCGIDYIDVDFHQVIS